VYFIYGMYWCFNAVTRAEGLPSAVLVRALEPLKNVELILERREFPRREIDLTNGPGKLCEALGIDGKLNGLQLKRGALVIRVGIAIPESEISVTPRIGITKAADWPLRWIVKGNPFVSRGKLPMEISRAK
jgi:DNA-3-methyladenine glycosylase